ETACLPIGVPKLSLPASAIPPPGPGRSAATSRSPSPQAVPGRFAQTPKRQGKPFCEGWNVGLAVRAVRFESGGAIQLIQLPNPQPGAEDVLVQALAAGVCRTDLHLLDEIKAGEREPLIPGHEIAGRSTKIGDDVYTDKRGDTVGAHFEQPCGRCRQCRRHRTNLR